jgi:hypothetical protein
MIVHALRLQHRNNKQWDKACQVMHAVGEREQGGGTNQWRPVYFCKAHSLAYLTALKARCSTMWATPCIAQVGMDPVALSAIEVLHLYLLGPPSATCSLASSTALPMRTTRARAARSFGLAQGRT